MGSFKKWFLFLSSKMTKLLKTESLNRGGKINDNMEKEVTSSLDFRDVEPEYKKLVDLACNQDLDFYISNSSLLHAKYVISKIINNTKNQMNIFSSKIDNSLFCDSRIVEAINKRKNISIRFLSVNSTDDETKNFKKLVDTGKIEIGKIKPQETLPFFIVSDNKMVRIESSLGLNKAKVNFNAKPLALHLNDIFSKLWSTKN